MKLIFLQHDKLLEKISVSIDFRLNFQLSVLYRIEFKAFIKNWHLLLLHESFFWRRYRHDFLLSSNHGRLDVLESEYFRGKSIVRLWCQCVVHKSDSFLRIAHWDLKFIFAFDLWLDENQVRVTISQSFNSTIFFTLLFCH